MLICNILSQYFLGDVSTAVITQLAGVLQSLPGYFGEKKIVASARNRLASSFLPRIICYFALVTGLYP